MNEENSLPPWLRQALLGAGLFLAGAILAFGYSYRPLHGALSWKVDQLEARLDERNRENVQLSDALARVQSLESTRIDPDTLVQVETELTQTKRVLDQAEKDLKRAERKRKESLASAASWRKRFEALRDANTSVATTSPPRIESSEPVTTPKPAAPAAPAPSLSEPGPTSALKGSQPSAERGILSASDASRPAKR